MAPKFISESASQHSPIGEIFLRINEKVIKLKVLDIALDVRCLVTKIS